MWWDPQSRRKTRTLEIATGYHALALSLDGLTAAVGVDRGILDPASWARRACTVANRVLTRHEWEEFLPGRAYEPACTT